MRSFSVSEEMLPIDPVGLRPASLKSEMTLRYEKGAGTHDPWHSPDQTQSALSVGLLGERIRVVGPREATLLELLETVRVGRALADRAARAQGRRAVALGSPIFTVIPERPATAIQGEPGPGMVTSENSMCGFRIHVGVDSPEEGVQVLDRIRVWLPVLLALSANSPFWHERPTRSNSFRYSSRSTSPFPRISDVFGSAEEYERQMRHKTHPAAARSSASTDLDAELSATRDTVNVLLTDVCMDAAHAAVVAAITRALVEVLARQWRENIPPATASVADLRAASWFAAMNGVHRKLMSPISGSVSPARGVVVELLELVCPVLLEYGEAEYVEAVVADLLHHGNGSRRQRTAYSVRQDLHDVVDVALRSTHEPSNAPGVSVAILAKAWALTHTEEAAMVFGRGERTSGPRLGSVGGEAALATKNLATLAVDAGKKGLAPAP